MKQKKTSGETSRVKVLDKTFDLLEAVGASEHGRSLSDLASDLNLPVGTVHRLLQQLVRRGYIEQDVSSKFYFLGLRVLVLRGQAIRSVQLAARARPHLREMMLATNCLSHLAVYRDGFIVYVDRVDSPTSLSVYVPIGNRVPAYCTALGKVLLASLPLEDLDSYLTSTSFEKLTPNTLTEPARLRKHLIQVREQGYALDMQEQHLGTWCVAAPIYDYASVVVAAISVSIREEPSRKRLEELIHTVVETAKKISANLGYQPDSMQSALEMQLT